MKQPEKWRDTIDPFSIKFNHFQLKAVLGYPHAGNDVFYVFGVDEKGQVIKGFLKVERQKTADIKREISILKKLKLSIVPKIIDYSIETPKYILTKEIEGERLSYLVGDNQNVASLEYIPKYAKMLVEIHDLTIKCEPTKNRNFMLEHDFFVSQGLEYVERYLLTTEKRDSFCFIHGDCHYANILWNDKNISGLLDFELSGYGSREYDLAWALVLRPGQKFLKTKEERELFLRTYSESHLFCRHTFNYYLVLFTVFFYKMELKSNDDQYKKHCMKLINELVK